MSNTRELIFPHKKCYYTCRTNYKKLYNKEREKKTKYIPKEKKRK